MTDDEKRVTDIAERVRKTICPTYSSDGHQSIEGRITADDFDYLMASRTSWKIIAKQNAQLAELTPTEQTAALEKALDATTADWLKALDEIDRLRGTAGTAH